jgi:ABC-type uncharacterized transport system substrate-binding protein
MIVRPFLLACAALAGALLFAPVAQAHPHVWVTIKADLVFGQDGKVTAVRHAWTFDEMFSAFATQGLDKNNDGKLSREELAELAEVNVTSLEEFNYFSVAKSGGKDVTFDKPVDYWLEADKDNVLTLHFTLPLKTAAPGKDFSLAGRVLGRCDPSQRVRYGDEESLGILFRIPDRIEPVRLTVR